MILEKASEIGVLMLKHLHDELTPEEAMALKAWVDESDDNRQLYEAFSNEATLQAQVKEYYTSRQTAAQRRTEAPVVDMPARSNKRWYRLIAAACILIIVAAAGYWWLKPVNKATDKNDKHITAVPIPAGKEGAILTLDDGTQIVLDSAANGKLADQGQSTITHKDGQISYRATKQPTGKVVYNTMSTPRGRQYKLLLSEGTAIWLNAASSVTYPAQFTGDTRSIKITGEVYLEVAPDKSKPFIVTYSSPSEGGNREGSIEVLGTRFALNAYNDEPVVTTTLLEGSIQLKTQVQGKNERIIMQPGEQIKVSHENLELIKGANTEEAIAFMNGFFSFKNSDIKSVMRQLEKWYDIEVSFTQPVGKKTFEGEIQRSLSLPVVLKILERNGFQFTVEGNRVQVK
jgi:ferric-dicitrate binding protein FerR (iron transport regulator)